MTRFRVRRGEARNLSYNFPMSLGFRLVLWVAALLSTFIAGRRLVESYGDEYFYGRDFVQEYVLARSLLDGKPAYRPLPEVVDAYFPGQRVPWTHATPHPPPTALATLPLGLMSYRSASIAWLVLQLICIAIAVVLLARCWGDPVTIEVKVLAFLLSLGLGPILRDLYLGQFSAILLVLLTLAWRSLRGGFDGWGGFWLGCTIALKLVGWPIALFLLIRGRWRAVATAGLVVVVLHAASMAVMGWPSVREYYLKTGPDVARDNRHHLENFSLWTVGSRVFMADKMIWANEIQLEPLRPRAALERPAAIALPLIALAASLVLARRLRSFDSAFGVVVCFGLVINPVVWDHYLLLTALPIVIAVRRLVGGDAWQKAIATLGLAITIIPRPGDLHLAIGLFATPEGDTLRLAFLPGLLTYLPLVALAIWIWLLTASDAKAADRMNPIETEAT